MIIRPDWPAPPTVVAFSTTRLGGGSQGPYASRNLSFLVGDDSATVTKNRTQLLSEVSFSHLHTIGWLEQVHGSNVYNWDNPAPDLRADAAHTTRSDILCAIMTADCLPILLCNREGTWVAAVHAGWRSLSAGIVQQLFQDADISPADCIAWLGPAIGPRAFEVGADVRDAFVQSNSAHTVAFTPHLPNKWMANIYTLAHQILTTLGVSSITGGDRCTYTEPDTFFSYRRDKGVTGRQASFIGLQEKGAFSSY